MISESSIITLKKGSVINNINFLKRKMGKNVRISSVVKANAYGHGIKMMVPLLEETGIDHFSVFDYSEAVKVSESLSSDAGICIMGFISGENLKDAIGQGFEFFCFDPGRIRDALRFSRELNKVARIHLEVETGMNRTGMSREELVEALQIISENMNHFEVRGLCTHLAGAESISNHLRIQKQIRQYHKMSEMVRSAGIDPLYRHIANSAAAFTYPRTRMDMVRIGIMQYGFWPSAETFIHYTSTRADKSDPLKRILGWKSTIMAVKKVKTGEFVNYGISYLAQSDIVTAVIPVGYSIGYSRSLSNRGRVLIRGNRCSIIGIVNMNMVVADITNVSEARVGDEVVIIGSQGELEIKVSAFSDISNRLNYEILSNLPEVINRVVIK